MLFGVLTLLLVGAISGLIWAEGTEELGPAEIPIEAGTGVAIGGIGMEFDDPATIAITVPAGNSVEQTILYWSGFNTSNIAPIAPTTMDIMVNRNAVTGHRIGGPAFFYW